MTEGGATRIGFIGAGRLAASLGAALVEAGYAVEGVASRHAESASRLAAGLGAEVRALTEHQLAERCDLVFLTVPDAAVADVATRIRWREGQAVVHCSGALTLAALGHPAAEGAATGCLHPLQSFPSLEGDASRFRGVTCGIEADSPLGGILETMANRIGANVVRLEGVDRAAYHAAAVFASNYVVALMAAARRVWTDAGLPAEAARPALAPLLQGAADNVARLDLREALTGPIARGDVETVRRHLGALGENELAHLYRALGSQLLALDLPHDEAIAAVLRSVVAPSKSNARDQTS